jgi:hypothetical protein
MKANVRLLGLDVHADWFSLKNEYEGRMAIVKRGPLRLPEWLGQHILLLMSRHVSADLPGHDPRLKS